MTPSLHVAPYGEPLSQHRLEDCPCGARQHGIIRDDGMTEKIVLHRMLHDPDEPRAGHAISATAARAA